MKEKRKEIDFWSTEMDKVIVELQKLTYNGKSLSSDERDRLHVCTRQFGYIQLRLGLEFNMMIRQPNLRYADWMKAKLKRNRELNDRI